MKELEVILPAGGGFPSVAAIDALLKRSGLRTTLRGTLAQYPGSVHWHLKRVDQPGVLELTHWREGKRVWFVMQDGRRATWVMQSAGELKRQIELKVAKSLSSAKDRRRS